MASLDGVDDDRVEQPADLEHVDRAGRRRRGAWRRCAAPPSPGRRSDGRGTPRRRAGRSLVCAKVPPELVDPVPQLTAARVTIVAGKGGVGKTTVTAVLARAAADAGLRVLVVELDGKPVLADLVERRCRARRSRASAALEAYLHEHGFGRVARRLTTSGVIDVVATAAPGHRRHRRAREDQAARAQRRLGRHRRRRPGRRSRHHVPDLGRRAARRRARGPGARAGPGRASSCSPTRTRCQVVLVTLPETTPVNEVVQTAYALEDRVGVRLGPVVVNEVDGLGERRRARPRRRSALPGRAARPTLLGGPRRFRRARRAMQDDEIARLGRSWRSSSGTCRCCRSPGSGPTDIAAPGPVDQRAARDPA